MKRKSTIQSAAAAARSVFLAGGLLLSALLPATVFAQQDDDLREGFREFTNNDGRSIVAAVKERGETTVDLELLNGNVATVPIDSLSDEDQQYIRDWDPSVAKKREFAEDTELKRLTVAELLTARGYESFEYILQSNHIYVDGMMHEKKARYLIDTGAQTSVLHVESAKEAELEIGPFDQVIYGIAGEAPAAFTPLPSLRLGDVLIENQTLLTADLHEHRNDRAFDAIFGADFLTQLNAVIDYDSGKMFLHQDKGSADGEAKPAEADFVELRQKDGRSYQGRIRKKTEIAVEFELPNKRTVTIPISMLVDEDREIVQSWDPIKQRFQKEFRVLSVPDLLEARKYQSFEYVIQGNHILVDGKLNGKDARFLIDTGADSTVIHVKSADEAGLTYGPFNIEIYGIGGKTLAAVTMLPTLHMGDALLENRRLLVTDLHRHPEYKPFDAIFGADFLRELHGVIDYQSGRIFLRQEPAPVRESGEDDKK